MENKRREDMNTAMVSKSIKEYKNWIWKETKIPGYERKKKHSDKGSKIQMLQEIEARERDIG